jgi:hypothetical protein
VQLGRLHRKSDIAWDFLKYNFLIELLDELPT